MTQLSPHFTLEEAIFSSTANRLRIRNDTFSTKVLSKAVNTAQNLELVRSLLGKPITIDSFIRTIRLNRALKSKDNSQHVTGEAVDFICPAFGTPAEICKAIVAAGIIFDQMILEHSWVHISFSANPVTKPSRNQVLSLLSDGKYVLGLTDKFGKPY